MWDFFPSRRHREKKKQKRKTEKNSRIQRDEMKILSHQLSLVNVFRCSRAIRKRQTASHLQFFGYLSQLENKRKYYWKCVDYCVCVFIAFWCFNCVISFKSGESPTTRPKKCQIRVSVQAPSSQLVTSRSVKNCAKYFFLFFRVVRWEKDRSESSEFNRKAARDFVI